MKQIRIFKDDKGTLTVVLAEAKGANAKVIATGATKQQVGEAVRKELNIPEPG